MLYWKMLVRSESIPRPKPQKAEMLLSTVRQEVPCWMRMPPAPQSWQMLFSHSTPELPPSR